MSKSKKKTSSYDRYLGLEAFTDGRGTRAWTWFGAHPHTKNGQDGFFFRVWAPNARQVSVFGPFNDWDARSHPLSRVECGIWEGFLPGLDQGMAYQYAIWSSDSHYIGKADPYAFRAPHPSSAICRATSGGTKPGLSTAGKILPTSGP